MLALALPVCIVRESRRERERERERERGREEGRQTERGHCSLLRERRGSRCGIGEGRKF